MSALLYDVAVLDYDDIISLSDGGESVCDNEAGLVLHKSDHSLRDITLCLRVDVRGSLVEDQHLRVDEHGSRYGDKLFLTL